MLIYLIRHGETAYNEEKRYQGKTDIPLSESGRAKLTRADFCPERVYVSPLLRAMETAEILFPGAELIAVSGLREMDFGVFEGRSFKEMEHDPDYRAWVEGGCVSRCPGGESREEFSARVWQAFLALTERETERLVIVAHGGTQMAIMERWARPHRDYFEWKAPCGGGFVLNGHELTGEVCYTKDGCNGDCVGRAGRL